jgi:hypothetical protein
VARAGSAAKATVTPHHSEHKPPHQQKLKCASGGKQWAVLDKAPGDQGQSKAHEKASEDPLELRARRITQESE